MEPRFGEVVELLRRSPANIVRGNPLEFWNPVTSALDLAPLQRSVDDWIQSIGVRYFSELTNLAQLMEEVGELARQLARRCGDQSFKPNESRSDLADEIADVLFVLVCIANQTGVDLTAAFARNLEKKTARDAERHRLNPKLQQHPAPRPPQ